MSLLQIQGVQDYERIVHEYPNVVVEFFATWCPHCKAMQPDVEQAAEQFEQVVIAQADVDQNEELCDAFNVQGTPTFIFVKDGKPVLDTVGQISYEDLVDFLQKGENK